MSVKLTFAGVDVDAIAESWGPYVGSLAAWHMDESDGTISIEIAEQVCQDHGASLDNFWRDCPDTNPSPYRVDLRALIGWIGY